MKKHSRRLQLIRTSFFLVSTSLERHVRWAHRAARLCLCLSLHSNVRSNAKRMAECP